MSNKIDLKNLTGKENDNTYVINNEPDIQGDEISLKAIEHLFDKKNRKVNSRIKFEQVSILAKLQMFGEVFETSFTKKLSDLMLDLQVSTHGLGRKETVNLVQRRDGIMEVPQTKTSKDIFR